ncbi:hypothetical protein [Pseudofrankia sp. DC12]|uniref:restriction endonuclease-related protein n=1 Tax=Pseudofrankia sp. DC12 TaxID=683315 RepID=UPI0005F7D9B7|nr:hypothetical protein [Pseudofrankia sp. DC12]
MTSSTDNDVRTFDGTRVRYLVTRAALRAATTMTNPTLSPRQRLAALMECHGTLLAARGPGDPLSFGDFRRALKNDLARLLPAGIDSPDLEGLPVVDGEDRVAEDAFDLAFEQRVLLKALDKPGNSALLINDQELQDEIDQETAFEILYKGGEQAGYVAGRSDLIRYPAGPVSDLCELRLPPRVVDLYQDIPYNSVYQVHWFPCPACRWPMRVAIRRSAGSRVGTARCWHGAHAEMGASYLFPLPADGGVPELVPEASPRRPGLRESVLFPSISEVPRALPAAGYKAVARGIWRYTTIPGLPELALYDRLSERGLTVELWPALDAYDLRVEAGPRKGRKETFKVDVKDYTSAMTLGKLIDAQEGDRGGAGWLVVPDYRAGQLPLLSGVCAKWDMKVATASEFGAMVCAKAGVSWA